MSLVTFWIGLRKDIAVRNIYYLLYCAVDQVHSSFLPNFGQIVDEYDVVSVVGKNIGT